MTPYQKAGVDVKAGYKLVDNIKPLVQKTKRLGFMDSIGSFAGLFDFERLNIKHPVLLSGTDGVGTKLLIAQKMNYHQTIGIDCVAMCVNDILAQGGQPLFFLDYIATGKNNPEVLTDVVKGVAAGCIKAKVSLIGGETAEMPGMYQANEYDLAGFCVGVSEKSDLLDKTMPKAGDALIGIASSGLHSNGFSLVRKILFQDHHYQLTDRVFGQKLLGDELLTPTKIYVKAVYPLIKKHFIHGIAHITGGGFYENVPRIFENNLQAIINLRSFKVPEIFNFLKQDSMLTEDECFHVFNMGIGMVLAVDKTNVDQVLEALNKSGEVAYKIGYLQEKTSNQEVVLER